MLATAGTELPAGPGWAFEMKWDGVRALAAVQDGRVGVRSRNGNDVTRGYPELHALGPALGGIDALLDGEIVAADDSGRASFQRLQSRMHLRDPGAVARAAREVPVVYVIFDVLWLDGTPAIGLAYRQRRDLLDRLALRGDAWQTPSSHGDGDAAFAISRELGFEGVVAKRIESVYEPGRRSPSWRKVKHQLRQEFVVGGGGPGQGAREERIGALLIGYYDAEGRLRYAGKVGTGFTETELDRLGAQLHALASASGPFSDRGLPRDACFVEPVLVAEVRFTEWTTGGRVRQPAYLGLRDDKRALDVTRE